MKNQLLSGDSALLKSAAKAALVLMVLALSGCPEPLPPMPGQAQWARTVSTGSDESRFSSVAVDAGGNVYAAGEIFGTGTCTFGTGVTAAGSGGCNVVLVKYNSAGVAQWARTVSAGSPLSRFYAVAVDSNGNVYAAGYLWDTGVYTFGPGVTAAGIYIGYNVVLVKYNSAGDAQWARTVSTGSDGSCFRSVAVDASGNAYAAGYIYSTSTFTFGPGVTIAGTCTANVALVKYNSAGVAQWARTVSAGLANSYFTSVTVETSGNVYTAGIISGSTETLTFGTGVTAAGTYSGDNVLLVKYNAAGVAQWARTVSTGFDDSRFFSVAVDAGGNVYAAGTIDGMATFTFGTGVTAVGTYNNSNVVLVKYNSSGTAQWARTVSTSPSQSQFSGVKVDASGNVYAAGDIYGTGTYTFGNGVTAAGTYNNGNVVLVKYNSSGVAYWARTVSTGTSYSDFNSVAVDASGNAYAAGYIYRTGTYTFGPGVTAAGTYINGSNVVLVKYSQ